VKDRGSEGKGKRGRAVRAETKGKRGGREKGDKAPPN